MTLSRPLSAAPSSPVLTELCSACDRLKLRLAALDPELFVDLDISRRLVERPKVDLDLAFSLVDIKEARSAPRAELSAAKRFALPGGLDAVQRPVRRTHEDAAGKQSNDPNGKSISP